MKKLLFALSFFTLLGVSHGATQIYIPSTSTYQGNSSVINIASATIRSLNISTLTVSSIRNIIWVTGADPTGVANSSSSFQTALILAKNVPGSSVMVPPGNYTVSGTTLTIYSSTTLMGTSYGSVTIKSGNSTNTRLLVNQAWAGTGTDYNINLENIIFDMNGTNQTGSTAVTFARVNNHVVRNCTFKNPYDSTYLLTGANGVTDNTDALYDNVSFLGTGQSQATDVVDLGNFQHCILQNSRVFDAKTNSGQAMLSVASGNDFVMKDSFLDANKNGVPISLFGINGGVIENCEIFNSTEAGVRYQNWREGSPNKVMANFSVANNNIHDNFKYGIWVRQDTDATDMPVNCSISHNKIWNNGRNGLEVEISTGLIVDHNFFYSNSKAIAGNYYAAEFIQTGTNLNSISNILFDYNIFSDTQSTPTQTKAFQLSYVSGFHTFGNQFQAITTTYTVNAGTTQNIFLFDGDKRFFTGSVTRDISLTNGSVAYTGLGFKPSSLSFYSVIPSSQAVSWGFTDCTTVNKGLSQGYNTKPVYDSWASASIILTDQTEANYETGQVTSCDTDGFTVSWAKTGSPVGTATINYMAYK